MEIIDNFDLIKPFFDFDEKDGLFFHLQIIQRSKEVKELKNNNRVIKHYYIESWNHLEKLKQEIIDLCNLFNARAYINLNAKSFKRLIEESSRLFLQRLIDTNYLKPYKIIATAAGRLTGNNPRWIIDIDVKDRVIIDKISSELETIYQSDLSKRNKSKRVRPDHCILGEIPTKNGVHLITTSFNLKAFSDIEPEINVHKNNPTVLYCIKK